MSTTHVKSLKTLTTRKKQTQVLHQVSKVLITTFSTYDNSYHEHHSPCLSATYNASNPVYIVLHIHKTMYEVQLSGAIEYTGVYYHHKDNPVLDIVDKITTLLKPSAV